MKIEFIRRGAATRLILIFAGWSTDAHFYGDCVVDGWDTAVVSDYRDMTLPEIPTQYSTIYVFAYSLGVWAASIANIDAAARIAIFGTSSPVSNEFGIPKRIFIGTAVSLSKTTLAKFHLRMAGSESAFKEMSGKFSPNPDIEALKEELLGIAERCGDFPTAECYHWHRTYIANADHIIPTQNQVRYWQEHPNTEIVTLNSSHYVDISSIIHNCIPDPEAIGEGFANALMTYSKYATVQSEVCHRMGEMIRESCCENKPQIKSLIEIGPGKGLLTNIWSKYLKPDKATYVDLYEMQLFGNAPDERYLVKDAEQWLESTDEKFDVILSASAIQWFANPISFISNVRKHLNPGGIAIISTFSKGNLRELDQLRPSPIIYHSIEEYGAIDGVKLDSWERTLQFQSSREMLMHLKRTGVKPSSSAKCFKSKTSLSLTSLPTSLTYTPLIVTLNPLTHATMNIGDKFPDLLGLDANGKEVRLSDFPGKKFVLYFYPKDNTPGCSAEACSLNDGLDRLAAAGFQVIGVSKDSASSHQKFIDKYSLKFPLVADTDTTLCQLAGVWQKKKMAGREYMGIVRTTFLLSPDGTVEQIIPKVNTKAAADQILSLIA